MINQFITSAVSEPAALPQHIQLAVQKMDLTIQRMQGSAQVTLFKTDYLE